MEQFTDLEKQRKMQKDPLSSPDEIKQQLDVIEFQTKQTNADLEQLFDRLKNNNQNLNKLLESISNYSKEVTTEGNATKHDVTRILERLKVLPEELIETVIQKCMDNMSLELMKQVTGTVNKSNETIANRSDARQDQISRQLSSIKDILDKLMMDSQAIKRHIDDTDIIKREEKHVQSALSGAEVVKLQTLAEQQIESLNLLKEKLTQKEADSTHDSVSTMVEKYTNLQKKYDTLSIAYKEKYQAFMRLEEHFKNLESQFDRMVSKIETKDLLKYGKLQQLHATLISQLDNLPLLFVQKKRITSMPIKSHEAAIHEPIRNQSIHEEY